MIKAKYNSEKAELRISGHANYAPEGQDIVCAGVSGLFAALAVHSQTRYEVLDEEHIVTSVMGEENQMKPLFDAIVNTIECIANEYPGHVQLMREM